MNFRNIYIYPYHTLKRTRYNYHLKNYAECQKNRKLLKINRSNFGLGREVNPMVSVLIPTYNRSKILTERTIPSILRQTYQNFEIIIVGDHCTDGTEISLQKFCDNRIKFYNLPERGNYPLNPAYRWMVAGSVPGNKCLDLCSGDWITLCDDDDEFLENHIEVLLNYALNNDYEMVYGKVKMEIKLGKWIELGSFPLKCGNISVVSVLYRSYLKFFRYDINSWKYMEPNDYNLWRRMKEAGVRIGFIDQVVSKHHLEKQQPDYMNKEI